jgi:3-dehydroquinate synthase
MMSIPARETVRVDLGLRGYDIVVTSADIRGFGPFARRCTRGELAFVVGDKNVRERAEFVAAALQAEGFRSATAILPSGERQKSLAAASSLYDQLVDLGADRNTLVVAVGGGVIGDLAGFVAATYARGLPLLMVPTTLLAMVDSSVGGKVAVNHLKAKNLIGAFHQPAGVWIDTEALETLPDREYRSGLAEVVKYGVIFDAELFAYLEANIAEILTGDAAAERHLIATSCRHKADVVEKDEREQTGLRVLLNYGHTFAHAFETVGGYGRWLHGEAVAAGMVCASRLAERRGLVDAEVTRRQQQLLAAFELPTEPMAWSVDALLATMRNDKKTVAGRLGFILPLSIGSAELYNDVPDADIRHVLQARSS